MRYGMLIRIFFVLSLLPALDACAAQQSSSNDQAVASHEWEECNKQQRIETKTDQCLDSCRGFESNTNEWVRCQKEEKCMYYDSLAKHNCSMMLYDRPFLSDLSPLLYMEQLQEEYDISPEARQHWQPNKK